MGSGSPFIANASRASRSSVSASSGVVTVKPSTLVESTQSAPACGPAIASTSAIRTPCQRALPARSPPTSLETQVRVIIRSIDGIAIRSA